MKKRKVTVYMHEKDYTEIIRVITHLSRRDNKIYNMSEGIMLIIKKLAREHNKRRQF